MDLTAWENADWVIGSDFLNGVGVVGEPSLTADGSICFVVIYEPDCPNPAVCTTPQGSTSTDHYDMDLWFLEKR